MNRKQLCVANVRYKKPTPDDAKRQKGLLHYLTYRDGRTEKARQRGGTERWHDLGLGRSIADITARCAAYQSQHVLAFTLVFNPSPEVMRLVPVEQREAFVCELTERSLSTFCDARGIEGGVEASYVLHHRLSEDPEAPGLHNPHTHVLLPGSYFDEGTGQREDLFFSRRKGVNHIDLLHRVTEGVMVDLLERHVGLDWEQRMDALEAQREQQRQITTEAPHGVEVQPGGEEIPFWVGLRSLSENTCALGYYRWYPPSKQQMEDGADATTQHLAFRPLVAGLKTHRVQPALEIFKDYLKQARTLDALRDLITQVRQSEPPEPVLPEPPAPSFPPVRSGPSLDF